MIVNMSDEDGGTRPLRASAVPSAWGPWPQVMRKSWCPHGNSGSRNEREAVVEVARRCGERRVTAGRRVVGGDGGDRLESVVVEHEGSWRRDAAMGEKGAVFGAGGLLTECVRTALGKKLEKGEGVEQMKAAGARARLVSHI